MHKFADTQCEQALGISLTQGAALMFIAKNEGCLQKALSDEMGMNHSAVTGLVGRMKKNDLIIRKPCEEDGRASRLFLSEKGRSKLPEIFPLIGKLNDKLSDEFSDNELDTVARFLNHIIRDFH